MVRWPVFTHHSRRIKNAGTGATKQCMGTTLTSKVSLNLTRHACKHSYDHLSVSDHGILTLAKQVCREQPLVFKTIAGATFEPVVRSLPPLVARRWKFITLMRDPRGIVASRLAYKSIKTPAPRFEIAVTYVRCLCCKTRLQNSFSLFF